MWDAGYAPEHDLIFLRVARDTNGDGQFTYDDEALPYVLGANATAGASPVIAGGLLWVYDPNGGLNVYKPSSGKVVRSMPAPSGHWNSPIIDGGRVYLPSGDSNSHDTTGTLSIYEP